MFKEVKLYWKIVAYKRKLCIGESPVGDLCISAMMLTNMRHCVYPTSIAQFFDCIKPSLEDYLVQKDEGATEE